ncbi:hypothetical protein V1260_03125 [Brachybacterium sp. J144]|uniref:hypothetical protein n=1 Tax=Brachybacterium sp. J144 TaxID=3116487 RepID=UPI002E792694|nr:hypothetical protein [Brachybacterium sp. J144]MEE1649774.1 hypothetical protein [Brachybacterium sp. J144]
MSIRSIARPTTRRTAMAGLGALSVMTAAGARALLPSAEPSDAEGQDAEEQAD